MEGDVKTGRRRKLRDGDIEIKKSTEELKMGIFAPIY